MNLTKRTIDALKPPNEGYALYWDDKLPGFGLRITALRKAESDETNVKKKKTKERGGVKAYFLNYRINGRERRITIGRHGPITLDEARSEAKQLIAQVGRGLDPLEIRQKDRQKSTTFEELADEYERVHLPRKKSGKEDKRLLDLHLRPKLRKKELLSITPREIQNLHRKIGESTPIQANRIASLLNKMFSLAIKWGWIEKNPAQGIERFKEEKRDRYVKEHELPRLMKAIQEESNLYIRGYILLLLLTGARKSELLTMRREDIDFELAEWRIPDTKAGRIHVLPLSKEAVEVIKSLPRVVGNPYVIVGRKEREHLKEPSKAWQRIRERAKLKDVRLHDLRRTVGSYMAMNGANLLLIGKVLNHSNPNTTQIYARLADEAPRAALEAIAATVRNASAKPDEPKVVPLRK